jgi:cob(I)alamin adenosyltransferase
VDELNSHLGMLKDLTVGQHDMLLSDIQNKLFGIGSRLASASEAEAEKFKVPPVTDTDIAALENAMDAMDKELSRNAELHPAGRAYGRFPGAHSAAQYAGARSAVWCRWAASGNGAEITVRYLNRLSDLLFVLARYIGHRLNVPETPWKPRADLHRKALTP